MITTKNRIGYIQRRYDENNVPHFKFIVAKIKRVNIGVVNAANKGKYGLSVSYEK